MTQSRSPLEHLLALSRSPVAISFRDEPPAGVPHVRTLVPGGEPAGCGYWRLAEEGHVFYTEAADHVSCPVGAHTHNAPLDPAQARELEGLVGTMIGLQYLTMEDVEGLPRRKTVLAYAIYAPLERAPMTADVVLVRARPRALMLLAEAAQAARVAGAGPTMGRPTCAVLPETLNSGCTSASFGCVGSRVYTRAGDDEAYFAIPGPALSRLEERLEVIARANLELEKFHRGRLPRVP
jgi:uncharacterized protein (DUF169 family)